MDCLQLFNQFLKSQRAESVPPLNDYKFHLQLSLKSLFGSDPWKKIQEITQHKLSNLHDGPTFDMCAGKECTFLASSWITLFLIHNCSFFFILLCTMLHIQNDGFLLFSMPFPHRSHHVLLPHSMKKSPFPPERWSYYLIIHSSMDCDNLVRYARFHIK